MLPSFGGLGCDCIGAMHISIKSGVPMTPIIYSGVLINDESVGQLEGNRITFSVPRCEIKGLEIARGSESKRPIIQSLFGLPLIGVGGWGVLVILGWFDEGGRLSLPLAMSPVAAIIGGWMIFDAVRQRTLLWIETDSTTHRIAFSSSVGGAELEQFIEQASTELKCPIVSRL